MEKFRYGCPLLLRSEFSVPLLSDSETSVILKPLSYSTVTSANVTQYMLSKDADLIPFQTIRDIIKLSVVNYREAHGFPNISSFVDQLPNKDISHLYTKLIEISTLTLSQLEALEDMLDIQFHPLFQDESWKCEICQKKRLDSTRGCGYLPVEKRDKSPILPKIGNRKFTECPISSIDPYVSSQASIAYSMFSQGVLPETGGLSEQTEWFIRVSLLYKRKIAEAERRAIEDSKNGRSK